MIYDVKNLFCKKNQIDLCHDPKRRFELLGITGKYTDFFPSFVAHSHFDFK